MPENRARRKKQISIFNELLQRFYTTNGLRDLPWRKTHNPYHIIVSELMLQQTQVSRVIEKYKAFLKAFPTVQSLAQAPLKEVLSMWNGLGYNRRAKFLYLLAQDVVQKRQGLFPKTIMELEKLPGIGPYTARAVAAFAYNTPSVFIETNIRTVFIHHFFNDADSISDSELMPLIEETLDKKNPRQWYWLLMDYGSALKSQGIRTHRQSKHYIKQSAFKGSRRQVRGAILKQLLSGPKTTEQLSKEIQKEKNIIQSVLNDLLSELLIQKEGRKYFL